MFDLRSDTVTQPTEAMKRAMMSAEVGDDVYEDDPTIKLLERYVAQISGYEDSLFVLSGTMGNQIAIMCHTNKGEAVLMHQHAHINRYEVGAISLLSSVYPILVDNECGYLRKDDVLSNARQENIHYPTLSCVVVENALGDGRVVGVESMYDTVSQAHHLGYKVHMDGARIFNASVSLNSDIKTLSANADSLMFCLSKGLGAPIGSMLCGSKDFIKRARRFRKMLGGGIRQGGFLAAAGLFALEHHVARLKNDHILADHFASILISFGYEVRLENRDINMVFFKLKSHQNEDSWITIAKEFDLILSRSSYGWMRIVTHLDITNEALLHFKRFLTEIEKVA